MRFGFRLCSWQDVLFMITVINLHFSQIEASGTKSSINSSIIRPQYTAFKANALFAETLIAPDLTKFSLAMIMIYPDYSVEAYF